MNDESRVVGLLYRADLTRFGVDIPAGLPTEEEHDPWEDGAHPLGPINIPLSAARFVAHEAGIQAAKAARKFLRRFDIRQPPE